MISGGKTNGALITGRMLSLTLGWIRPRESSQISLSILGCEYGLPFFLGVKRWALCVSSICLIVLSIHPKQRVVVGKALLSGFLHRKHEPDLRRRLKMLRKISAPFGSVACVNRFHTVSHQIAYARLPAGACADFVIPDSAASAPRAGRR